VIVPLESPFGSVIVKAFDGAPVAPVDPVGVGDTPGAAVCVSTALAAAFGVTLVSVAVIVAVPGVVVEVIVAW
jgi:hypothetical protein